MLAGLLAPLRLPERVLEALDELRPMRLELTRVREQTEPLAGLLPALQRVEKGLGARLDVVHEVLVALESDESHLNTTTKELCVELAALSNALAPVDDRLAGIERTIDGLASDVGAIQENLVGLKDDIQRVTGLRGERGVIERARDAITGGHQAQDQPTSPAPESGSRGEPPP
ncbi:hypothetical protein BH20ACT19_BH20ACT19_08900 [soil metagenome]